MTDTEFLSMWKTAHLSKDDGAWALCALAFRAREENFTDWNVRLAVLERRRPRVIRDWVRAYEIKEVIGAVDGLTYTFYVAAGRYVDRLDPQQICELMRKFAAEQGATLEEFCSELREMAGDLAYGGGFLWSRNETNPAHSGKVCSGR